MSVNQQTISLKNDLNEIERLAGIVEEFCKKNNVSSEMLYSLNVALDEITTNIISYSWDDDAEHEILINIAIEDGLFTAVVEDDGRPFNPLEVEEVNINASVEEKLVGGLGIHFSKTLMDKLEYKREKNKNILTMKKKVI